MSLLYWGAGDINLSLFFCYDMVFIGDGLWAKATAVSENILRKTEECRMTMQIDFAVLVAIPLGCTWSVWLAASG